MSNEKLRLESEVTDLRTQLKAANTSREKRTKELEEVIETTKREAKAAVKAAERSHDTTRKELTAAKKATEALQANFDQAQAAHAQDRTKLQTDLKDVRRSLKSAKSAVPEGVQLETLEQELADQIIALEKSLRTARQANLADSAQSIANGMRVTNQRHSEVRSPIPQRGKRACPFFTYTERSLSPYPTINSNRAAIGSHAGGETAAGAPR